MKTEKSADKTIQKKINNYKKVLVIVMETERVAMFNIFFGMPQKTTSAEERVYYKLRKHILDLFYLLIEEGKGLEAACRIIVEKELLAKHEILRKHLRKQGAKK